MAYKNIEDQRASNRRWYTKNKATVISRTIANKRKSRKWLLELKRTLKCSRCPENHPACLDFHHINPADKEISIATAVFVNGWTKARILKEIEKCIMLCANCHRKENADIA